MAKFKVDVEKRMYSLGCVIVECDTEEEAVLLVDKQIERDELKREDVDWGDTHDEPRDEMGTFNTTGDVEETKEIPLKRFIVEEDGDTTVTRYFAVEATDLDAAIKKVVEGEVEPYHTGDAPGTEVRFDDSHVATAGEWENATGG
jgi:hypothetical protein